MDHPHLQAVRCAGDRVLGRRRAPADAPEVNIWSVVHHGGLLLASDRNFGLYILKLKRPGRAAGSLLCIPGRSRPASRHLQAVAVSLRMNASRPDGTEHGRIERV